MPDSTYRLTDDFPPLSAGAWREKVAEDLKGEAWTDLVSRSRAGLEIRPLYTSEDFDAAGDPAGFPGGAPHTRGGADPGRAPAWDVRPEFKHPDPRAANADILRDLARGATSVLVVIDPRGIDGVAVRSADDLDATLAGVDLAAVPIALKSGPRFTPVARLLDEVLRRRGVAPAQVRGALLADPLTPWCVKGALPVPLDRLVGEMADLAARNAEVSPGLRAVSATACTFHNAGADEVQELALTMGAALTYLEAMSDAGLDIDAAAGQIQFCFSTGGALFGEMAKLRAARTLWGRIVAACGGSPEAQRMQLHARTSARMMSARDPWVNILRTTTAAFAAIAGGADSLTVTPFDGALNVADGFSRRIARNVQIILQDEARVGQVLDPAGGSWHLERRTAETATAAWDLFREVQSRGGLVAGLREGWIQAAIAERREAEARDVARRKIPLTGVSEFPDLEEASVSRECPAPPPGESPGDLRLDGEDGGAHDPVAPLPPGRTAEPFETLRDAADAHRDRTGARPRVFLCNLGTFAQHNARATWIRNALAAGGIVAPPAEGCDGPAAAAAAFAASGARAAVICGSDEVYAETGPVVAAALHEAGAGPLLLAGRFGDLATDWHAAGVETALYLGCDLLAALTDLHRALEVTS